MALSTISLLPTKSINNISSLSFSNRTHNSLQFSSEPFAVICQLEAQNGNTVKGKFFSFLLQHLDNLTADFLGLTWG